MKKSMLIAFLLTLCMLLTACALAGGNENPDLSGDQQTDITDSGDSGSADNPNTGDGTAQPIYPAELTVELVVEWAIADVLLSHLNDLSDQLRAAIEEAGCPLDRVTLTISTAGGFSAQSLVQGGIDAAILPAVDIISLENNVSIIALSGEEIPETAIAVSRSGEELSEEFCRILLQALTEIQTGQDFLAACCGDAVFSVPTEDTLQAVRDYLKNLDDHEGGILG